jgi:hypothetical protein
MLMVCLPKTEPNRIAWAKSACHCCGIDISVVAGRPSALSAVPAADDTRHEEARKAWPALLGKQTEKICTNRILAQAAAVAQRHLALPGDSA